MNKYLITIAIIFAGAARITAAPVHCNNDAQDVENLVSELRSSPEDIGGRAAAAAQALTGRPYSEVTKLDTVGNAEVSLHSFDDMSFINVVAALARASEGIGVPLNEYEKNYVAISRRGGTDNGFASIMIYGADWVTDNVYRGNVKEIVPEGVTQNYKMKSLDYVSHHSDEYRCLENPETLDKLRMVEFGFRSHRIPHLKREELGKKRFLEEVRDGDIIMLLTNDIDRDIYLIGYVVKRKDGPHLIYASQKDGAVIESALPLFELGKRLSKHSYGFRWFRLRND